MPAPFILITTYQIKEGKLEGFRQFLQELFTVLEANEPRVLAINAYLNDAGTEAAIVQVHPDAASIRRYWQVVHQHSGRAFEQFVDATANTQVFGDPSGLILERTRHSQKDGELVSVKPEHLGGFVRLAAAVG